LIIATDHPEGKALTSVDYAFPGLPNSTLCTPCKFIDPLKKNVILLSGSTKKMVHTFFDDGLFYIDDFVLKIAILTNN
jgi:hypothetical protein